MQVTLTIAHYPLIYVVTNHIVNAGTYVHSINTKVCETSCEHGNALNCIVNIASNLPLPPDPNLVVAN